MHDEHVGHIYNRAHTLHPTLGRFMQRDPINQNQPGGGYQDGMNLYEYVRSNPITFTAPLGLCSYAVGLCSRLAAVPALPEWIPERIRRFVHDSALRHDDVAIAKYDIDDCSGDAVEKEIWGFYAVDFNDAVLQGALSLVPFVELSDGWVEGEVRQATVETDCQMECVEEVRYREIKSMIEARASRPPPDYHVLDYNCQDWANEVLNTVPDRIGW